MPGELEWAYNFIKVRFEFVDRHGSPRGAAEWRRVLDAIEPHLPDVRVPGEGGAGHVFPLRPDVPPARHHPEGGTP